MDELTDQLRQLGEASQQAVAAVSVDDVHSRSSSGNEPAEIGAAQAPPSQLGQRRRVSARVLVAAAVTVLVVAASVTYIGGNDQAAPLEVTSAIQDRPSFAVPADDNGWKALRQCESTGIYDTDTGNTFYGAYQFARSSWREATTRLGLDNQLRTNPATAPPALQDAIANDLYSTDGQAPWPVCGAHLTGPMITPVVPQWMGGHNWPQDQVAIFINPDVSAFRLGEIADELAVIAEAHSDDPTQFLDQDEAFAEFQAMFRDNQNMGSVQSSDLPPRFEITGPVPPQVLQDIRDITGVFDVIDTPPIASTAPLRLSIPALDLAIPVYASASITNLNRGAVAMVNDGGALVIAGFGSVDDSVFDRLDELRDGNVIIVTTLRIGDGTPFEVVRRFVVDLPTAEAAPLEVDVDNLQLPQRPGSQRLVLVADVNNDPRKRLVVFTSAVDPGVAGYDMPTED